MASTPSLLSKPEPSWQMMWHGIQMEVLSLKHQLSHWYLEMSQEYTTFERVVTGCF